jgi:hypothetical protein
MPMLGTIIIIIIVVIIIIIDPCRPTSAASNKSPLNQEHEGNLLTSALEEYHEARTLRSQLKAQLIQAIPHCYISELADPDLGYAKVTPREILQHIIANHGEITQQDLTLNLNARKPPGTQTPSLTPYLPTALGAANSPPKATIPSPTWRTFEPS